MAFDDVASAKFKTYESSVWRIRSTTKILQADPQKMTAPRIHSDSRNAKRILYMSMYTYVQPEYL